MAEAALGLGSNLGDKAANIEAALARLAESGEVRVTAQSSLYRTEPWGDTAQDWYLNACALVETDLAPRALLAHVLATEQALGRTRDPSRRWGPRVIDVDVLFHGDAEMDDGDLALPHPRLFERPFVLVPLAKIAGTRSIAGRSIGEAAAAVDRSGVALWGPSPAEKRPSE